MGPSVVWGFGRPGTGEDRRLDAQLFWNAAVLAIWTPFTECCGIFDVESGDTSLQNFMIPLSVVSVSLGRCLV